MAVSVNCIMFYCRRACCRIHAARGFTFRTGDDVDQRAYIYAAGRGMLPFQRQLCRGMLCAAYRKAFSRAAQHTLHLDGIAAYHDIKYVYAVLYPEPRQRDNGNPFGRRAVSHGSFYGADRSDM